MSTYKKQLPIAVAALLCSSQLGASLAYQQQGFDERLSAVERELADRRNVSPVVSAKYDIFVTGDYLLWHANECGLAYGAQVSNDGHTKGSIKNVDFGWDSGFRLGVGCRMPHDNWEVSLNWTCFSTDADGSTNTSSDLIFPEWSTAITSRTGALITHMSGNWDMHLNILDGEIGRYLKVTRWLALKPHFGLRGAWIDQSYKAKLNGGVLGTAPIARDQLKITNNFSGVGLRVGLDTEWGFVRQWSVYGNAAYSLVYGHFSLKHHEDLQAAGASGLSAIGDVTDNFQQIVGMAELGLGLRWDYTFSNQWIALRLQAGWEFNAYFGQNKFEHFAAGATSALAFVANNEALTVQGFVLSGRVDF